MAVDDVRIRARQKLEALIGVDEAAFLVADRPVGGWDSLVTKEHLALELATLRHELRAEMAELRTELRTELHDGLRTQTWRLAMLVVAAQAVVVGAIGGIGAVLRFA
jgi:hypothetical protein